MSVLGFQVPNDTWTPRRSTGGTGLAEASYRTEAIEGTEWAVFSIRRDERRAEHARQRDSIVLEGPPLERGTRYELSHRLHLPGNFPLVASWQVLGGMATDLQQRPVLCWATFLTELHLVLKPREGEPWVSVHRRPLDLGGAVADLAYTFVLDAKTGHVSVLDHDPAGIGAWHYAYAGPTFIAEVPVAPVLFVGYSRRPVIDGLGVVYHSPVEVIRR